MAIHPIVSTNCLSLGDAIRLLDHKDVIKTDFILVSGDVITNMKLNVAMDAHRRRRQTDKSAIMTLVMRAGMTQAHRIRLGASGVTTVIDPGTSRLLKYEEHAPVGSTHRGGGGGRFSTNKGGLRIDAAFFSERDDITIRSDLIETGVYLCAPEVLMLFSDNFDYQNVKRDFVSGVLSEEELGNKLYIHEVRKDYLARVHSLRSYDAISRDIMARWTYPLVPDTNLFESKSRSTTRGGGGSGGEKKKTSQGHRGVNFALGTVSEDEKDDETYDASTDDDGVKTSPRYYITRREGSSHSQKGGGGGFVGGGASDQYDDDDNNNNNDYSPELGPRGRRSNYRYNPNPNMVYLDSEVILDRSASVTNAVTVGSGTNIASGASIQQCVIGRDCEIGENAHLHGCYLGDGVVIGSDVVAVSSMLCDRVVVKKEAKIESNVVLSNGVVVDRRVVVPSGSRVSLIRPPLCGPGGVDDSDDELEVPHCQSPSNAAGTAGGAGKFTTTFSSDDDSATGGNNNGEFCDGPEQAVLDAAHALAADGIPDGSIDFSTDIVGLMGAGFLWPVHQNSESSSRAAALMGIAVPVEALEKAMKAVTIDQEECEDEVLGGGDESEFGGGAEGGLTGNALNASLRAIGGSVSSLASMRGAASGDLVSIMSGKIMSDVEMAAAIAAANEPHFKREVAETFLRCVKENISHENVVIELNGLKIAEDKTFADCARFMLTTALGLCLPAPLAISHEYRGLYIAGDVDADTKDGKLELLKRTAVQFHRWKDLLTKFLKNEEDQVELLLTLEEFCGEEGDFEGTGEKGAAFAAIFPQLLKLLYQEDIVGEEALLAWAEEKTHADDDEKRFLRLAEPFLEWLQEAEEESSEDEEEETESSEEDE
jgi:NDP-sugar pyrophosphorylase family protein